MRDCFNSPRVETAIGAWPRRNPVRDHWLPAFGTRAMIRPALNEKDRHYPLSRALGARKQSGPPALSLFVLSLLVLSLSKVPKVSKVSNGQDRERRETPTIPISRLRGDRK